MLATTEENGTIYYERKIIFLVIIRYAAEIGKMHLRNQCNLSL